jgi:hypothetical protein
MAEGTPSIVPQRNTLIEEAPLQSELMLFDPATSKFFVLNSTMAFLWRNADGNRRLDELVAMVTDSFRDADAEQIGRDVARAAEEMRELGLFLDSPAQPA